jgi:hypothetical protein
LCQTAWPAGSTRSLCRWPGSPRCGIGAALDQFDGLFVGGTLPWKLATAAEWVRVGHAINLPVHIGRVGTGKRVRWAKRIGADSIDSALPLRSMANLRSFVVAVFDAQLEIPEAA